MAFNKKFGNCRRDVGIWHETYLTKPGQYESVYSGMPPFGLGKVGNSCPQAGLATEQAIGLRRQPSSQKINLKKVENLSQTGSWFIRTSEGTPNTTFPPQKHHKNAPPTFRHPHQKRP
jgi:hypothetical protein